MASIKGAEIFHSGKWNGLQFSDDDVADIVSSFDTFKLSGRVPLKLGHEGPDARDVRGSTQKDPLSQLAMGWVTRVYQQGKKLMADFEVPDQVFKLIKQGFLKFVSVELLKDVQAGTRVVPWVLDAVALLGSDQPAVGVLKDLQALTMARATDLPFGELVAFARADDISSNFNTSTKSGVATRMANENDESLADKVLQLSKRLTDLESENRTLKSNEDKIKTLSARFTEATDQIKKMNVDAHRKELTDTLERAVNDKVILPAVREKFTKIFEVDNDERVMRIELKDVQDFIRDNPNPHFRRSGDRKVTLSSWNDTVQVTGMLPDAELKARTDAYFIAMQIPNPTVQQKMEAAKMIFSQLPELGKRYQTLPDDLASGNV